jgi:hypothetical protein
MRRLTTGEHEPTLGLMAVIEVHVLPGVLPDGLLVLHREPGRPTLLVAGAHVTAEVAGRTWNQLTDEERHAEVRVVEG